MLQKQKVHIPLSEGQKDSVDEILLSPPGFNKVDSMEFGKDGVLTKASGAGLVTTTGLNANLPVNTLIPYGNELLGIQRGLSRGLHRFAETEGEWFRTKHGGVWPVSTRLENIRRGQFDTQSVSCAHIAPYTCWVWSEGDFREDNSNSYYMVIDQETGNRVLGPVLLTNIRKSATVIPVGTDRFVIYGETLAQTTIYGLVLQVTGTGVALVVSETSAETKLAADSWSVVSELGQSTHYLVRMVGATNQLRIQARNTSLTVTTTLNGAQPANMADDGIREFYWHRTGSLLYVLYRSSTGGLYGLSTADSLGGALGAEVAIDTTHATDRPWDVASMVYDGTNFWIMYSAKVRLRNTASFQKAPRIYSKAARFTTSLVVVADTAHAIPGCSLIGRGYLSTDYGVVFPVATPDNTTGSPPHTALENFDAYTPGTPNVSLATLGQTTPFGGNGYVVAFYQDSGGSIPGLGVDDTRTAAEGVGTVNYRSGFIANFATDRLGYGRSYQRPITDGTGNYTGILGHRATTANGPLWPLITTFKLEMVLKWTDPSASDASAEYGSSGVELSFPEVPLKTQNVGSSVLISGGHLANFDGEIALENSPLTLPHILWWESTGGLELQDTYTPSIGVDPLTRYSWAGGTMSGESSNTLELIWTWRDTQGNTHRSAPNTWFGWKVPSPFIVGSGTLGDLSKLRHFDLVVALPPQIYLHRDQNFYREVQLEVYISAPSTDDGTTVVQGSSEPRLVAVQRVEPDSTYPYAMKVRINAFDNSMESLSYTFEGELGSECIPPADDILVAKGRVWFIDRDEPTRVWYSKPIIRGLAPEFNAVNIIHVPEDRDGFTALAEQDDKILLFTQDKIYYVAGDGPDATGRGNQFYGPKRVQIDVGCTNKHSVVSTPKGTVFESKRGIFLLDRNMVGSHIGGDIEETYRSTSMSLPAACLVPKKNQVRFLVQNPDLDNFAMLWDYDRNAWATLAVNEGRWSGYHCALWRDYFTWSTTGTATIYQEDPTVWTLNTTPYFPSIETGWIKVDGLTGFQRIWKILLQLQYWSGNLVVSVGYDYRSTYEQVATFTKATHFATLSGGAETVVALKPKIQKCKAFRLKIEEADDNQTKNPWVIVSGITLEAGVKRTAYKNFNRSRQA